MRSKSVNALKHAYVNVFYITLLASKQAEHLFPPRRLLLKKKYTANALLWPAPSQGPKGKWGLNALWTGCHGAACCSLCLADYFHESEASQSRTSWKHSGASVAGTLTFLWVAPETSHLRVPGPGHLYLQLSVISRALPWLLQVLEISVKGTKEQGEVAMFRLTLS